MKLTVKPTKIKPFLVYGWKSGKKTYHDSFESALKVAEESFLNDGNQSISEYHPTNNGYIVVQDVVFVKVNF